MSKRAVLWIVVGLSVLVLGSAVAVVVLAGGAAFLLARDGAPGLADEREIAFPPQVIALGRSRAVFLEGTGIERPMRVRRVDASEGAPGATTRWEWTAPPNSGASGWTWWHANGRIVGELHTMTGTPAGPARLAIFDEERGHVATLPEIVRDGFYLGEDGALLVMLPNAIAYYPPGAAEPAWRVPHAAENMMPRLWLTETHAFVSQESSRILGRTDGSVVREVPARVNVGIDVRRGEMLWLRDGRIVVENLVSGAEVRTLDLTGGAPIVDAMEEPLLLGAHGDHWIIVYSTELDHIFEGTPTWTRPAPRTLAAVRPETGEVVWRTEIGRWEHDSGMTSRRVLAHAQPLPANLLLHFDGDREGGGALVGHLVYVSLTDGAIRWQTDYDEPTRSNALFHRVDGATYLLVRDVNDGARTALARFEDGKLTGARSLPDHGAVRGPAMTASEVWLPTETGYALVHGAQMQIAGVPNAPADARAWVAERLRLPAEAR